MKGRFNRIARERGLLFASYFYVVGESLNLLGTYLLYTHKVPYMGDAGSWLEYVGVNREKYLDVGPVVYGLRLSPVLLLDYLIVNGFFYPLMAYELAFCNRTAAMCGAVASKFRPQKVSTIPKAPPISRKK
ncbi:hypothetical protein STCU_03936 [Strigomonas culicis]|uniref:Uncharacterized protein n=1 Tax=Strigomonas culicis TaxID=28005 RepID=S9W4C0_9TRYP|nr:hypothetical protein STCU_03936 [Strigomonas culicis]|eukprot:EPY30700.1 hypothetical protein STCU_03936 [Strigomonas culicis]